VLIGGDDDAQPGARVDVDMGIDAALTDQPQLGQPLEQRRPDLGPLTDEDQCLARMQPFSQRIDVLDMVIPDRDVVGRQLVEALECSQRVEPVVEDGNLHSAYLQRPLAHGRDGP
jgi:hypothetical protein